MRQLPHLSTCLVQQTVEHGALRPRLTPVAYSKGCFKSKEHYDSKEIGGSHCKSRRESRARVKLLYRARFVACWGVRPGDKLLFESDEKGIRVRPVRDESPFARYRGIGNPGIPSGRKGITGWVRKMRNDDDRVAVCRRVSINLLPHLR